MGRDRSLTVAAQHFLIVDLHLTDAGVLPEQIGRAIAIEVRRGAVLRPRSPWQKSLKLR
jgi:hypothetical protein